VVPGTADTVTIAATHVVTVDGTYVTGGDVAGGFILSGTLKASRTVSSSLTVRANINPNLAGGGFDYGTVADPIPQGVTAALIYNDSATLAVNKYQFVSAANNANFSFCGAPKTRNAFLTAPVSAGATSISVTSASGWVVGDQLYLEQPTTTMSQIETVTITSISGTTIGVSAITNERVSGLAVSNITCNVTLRTSSPSFSSTANFRASTTTGVVEFRNILFNHMGNMFFPNASPMVNVPIIDSCVSQNTATVNSAFNSQNQSSYGNTTFSNNVFISVNTGTTIVPNLSQINFNNNVCYSLSTGGSNLFITSSYGNFGNGNRFNGFNAPLGFSAASLSVYTNTRIRSQNTFPIGNTIGDFNVLFNTVDILTPSTIAYTNILTGALGTITFQNPTVDSVTKLNGNWAFNSAKVLAYSIGGVFNANRQSTYTTLAVNQNALVNRATNNIALQLNNSQPTGTYTFTFQGVTGVSQRIVGYLRHDTTYGTSNPPSISFSGAGVSGSFVSSSTVDIWEQFDITLTPTEVATITATVTFAGDAGGTAYLDSVYQFPWITENWIYGFQRLAQVNSIVDANVTLSESSVAALASCTTLDNVYDAATYSAIVAGPAAGAYSVIAVANGTALAFGSNSVTINNGAASAFAFASGTATIKSAALTSGAKFTSMSAASFTMTTPVTNTTLVGNVSQATPTNLTGVNITGNLTFNTNTPITVTFTNCNVSGTISNTGSGLVKVVKAGTTDWLTSGSNVSVIANVVVETPGGLALSTYIVKNGSTDLGWVAQDTDRTLEIQETDTFQIYAIAYGYKAALISATATNLTTFRFELIPEPFIDTSLSTVTRDLIASKFSTALDAFGRIALSLDTDLRYYTPDEVMNAIEWYIVTEGDLIAAGVVYAGSIDGVSIINGGIEISTPGFYGKVNDSVTTTTALGILVPIYIDVDPAVYVADPTYTPVQKNSSNIILQTAPWTQMTADISSVDKTDIRNGLATEDNVSAVRFKTDSYLDVAVSSRLSTATFVASGGTSGGAPTAEQNAAAVRVELATELARVDVTTSSRLAASGYTPPSVAPTAAQNASAVRTELTTELGRIDATTSSRLAASGYTSPDNASIAAIKVTTDLNLDVQVSSRLAASGYTAPDNVTIAAIQTTVNAALDVPVSSRLAASGYTAPTAAPTSAQNASAVRTELATELARIDDTISSRLAASGYTASGAPTAAENATAVRTELATELARIDTSVASRLAASGYTAPDNASITTIKQNTGLIPALL
jgi:hypothetical protein